jgi:hypothetical protein
MNVAVETLFADIFLFTPSEEYQHIKTEQFYYCVSKIQDRRNK